LILITSPDQTSAHTNMKPNNFPNFALLPMEIQQDIWQRAAYDIITTPSVQFLNLTRDSVDPSVEGELFASTQETVREAAGPGWDQLPAALQETVHDEAFVLALRKYRASLVGLEPAAGQTGLVEYGNSPWKQLQVLAAACSEAEESVKRVMKELAVELGAPVEGVVPQESNILAALVQPNFIICLSNLWTEVQKTWPIFSNRGFVGGTWGSAERYKGQAVIVPCTLGFLTDFSGDSWVAGSADVSPSLRQACPELAGLRKVAFVYPDTAGEEDMLWLHPFRRRLGLGSLWPDNLPNLTDIYLIDKSISLRSDSCRLFIEATDGFMGCGATFYEVSPQDTELWNITTANGDLLPVFEEAASLQQEYGAEFPVTVRVLACVPDLLVA
jgi:hypothetical protein